ncbi:EGLN [Mytilus coruscus]|uniref:hypoxia-inducible factor-proline dioxygenase n=1 Tax=Mytilus coruscus TaxID=42192 RepID=A0A6J8AHJ7_MYTCO|nr:EGLN [Mytilus coruscus]
MEEASLFVPSKCLKCNVCGSTENLKRCARCRNVLYCCREHQIANWSTHKSKCRKPDTQKDNDCYGHVSISGIKDDDVMEFDKRDFIETEFTTPKTKDPLGLGKFIIQMLKKQGYCVVDGLFEQSHLHKVREEVRGLEMTNVMEPGKLAGGRTGREEKEKVVNANIRSDKLKWMEGNENEYPNICKVIKIMDTILVNVNLFFKGQHNINRRTKAMVATYPANGTYYRRHIDNPNKDGRLITCILYLNKDWDVQRDGGLLRIFSEGSDMYVDVPPLLNRLLFFWSDRRNPHEVQPSYKCRYAVTVWYFDEKELEAADLDQMNKTIQETYGNLVLMKVESTKKEKKEIEDKIESETQRVLGSLSEGELDYINGLPTYENYDTCDEHIITVDEHDITGNEHNITGDVHDITGDEHNITGDEHDITGDEHNITGDEHDITGDEHNITGDEHDLTGDEHDLTGDEHDITGDEHDMTDDEHDITGYEHDITGDEHNITGDEHDITGDVHHDTGVIYNENHDTESPISLRHQMEVMRKKKHCVPHSNNIERGETLPREIQFIIINCVSVKIRHQDMS